MNPPAIRTVFGELGPVDILAIGPHPDDIEIGAAGALLRWRASGKQVGLIDLTRGELGTKGDAETRWAEAGEAARRIGARFRINLGLTDGDVRDDSASRAILVEAIRKSRPRWVLANLEEEQHPDHAAGARLAKAAFFLSRLPKFLPEIEAYSPYRLFFYLIHRQIRPDFLVDITGFLASKLEVMSAFESQFVEPSLPEGYRHTGLSDYLQNVRALNEAFGIAGGVGAAEGFLAHKPLVVASLDGFV